MFCQTDGAAQTYITSAKYPNAYRLYSLHYLSQQRLYFPHGSFGKTKRDSEQTYTVVMYRVGMDRYLV